MYQIGDQVVYGSHGVCSIVGLEQRRVDRKHVEYYALEPQEQPGARFYVPTQNQAAVAKMRAVITAQELDDLLHSDAVHQDCWVADEGQRKNRYRELIGSGDRAALLSMIGSLYRHKEQQAAMGRKFHLCDENFLRDAEKLISAEFSLVLGIDVREVGPYIRKALADT